MLEIYNRGVSKATYGDEPSIYACGFDNKHKPEVYTEDQKTIFIQQQPKTIIIMGIFRTLYTNKESKTK